MRRNVSLACGRPTRTLHPFGVTSGWPVIRPRSAIDENAGYPSAFIGLVISAPAVVIANAAALRGGRYYVCSFNANSSEPNLWFTQRAPNFYGDRFRVGPDWRTSAVPKE